MALDKPRRRTLVTGQSLPAITTDFQSFLVAPDEDDIEVGSVRAFTVNVRNRDSDGAIFVREGADGDDVRIAPHEYYPIYEPNGISSVQLRGENGGEVAEIRVVVAHNDFNLRDRIDGFLWSLSQYVGTATRDTIIQDANVTFDTAIQSADGVTFDSQIVGSDVTFDTNIESVTGNVPVSLEADNVGGIDMNLSGSEVTQDIDIADMTGDFDVRTFNRGGSAYRRTLQDFNVQVTSAGPTFQENTWTVFDPATADFLLESAEIRIYDPGNDQTIDWYGPKFEIDYGNTGSWDEVGLRRGRCRRYVQELSDPSDPYVTAGAFASDREVSWTLNWPFGLEVREGDSFRLVFDGVPDAYNHAGAVDADIQTELLFTRRQRQDPSP